MDSLKWFRIQAMYQINPSFNSDEELSEVEKIQLRNEGITDDFETDYAYLNLGEDTIIHLNPKCFIPKKDNDRKYRKYYTEIVMKSGDVIYAVGKPENVYDKLNEYLDSLPTKEVLN